MFSVEFVLILGIKICMNSQFYLIEFLSIHHLINDVRIRINNTIKELNPSILIN